MTILGEILGTKKKFLFLDWDWMGLVNFLVFERKSAHSHRYLLAPYVTQVTRFTTLQDLLLYKIWLIYKGRHAF